ncbi:MAG: hypothetical protein JWR52_1789 [Marmoricola sp.]|nr:hypothetical protein [Marmoricola sp.]
MGWANWLILLPVYTLGLLFNVMLLKSLWTVFKEQRSAIAADPEFKKKLVRNLAGNVAAYVSLGFVFCLGWLDGGVSGGVIATASVLVVAALVLAGWAIKSAWVKSA